MESPGRKVLQIIFLLAIISNGEGTSLSLFGTMFNSAYTSSKVCHLHGRPIKDQEQAFWIRVQAGFREWYERLTTTRSQNK